mgnify:CR=1 FL=1
MNALKINLKNVFNFISEKEFNNLHKKVDEANGLLHNKKGRGNDYLGWVTLPHTVRDEEISRIELLAKSLKKKVEVIVTIGIGGSYLGSRAVLEALNSTFESMGADRNAPLMLFAGQNIGEDYMKELLSFLDDKSYAIIVISKSGTTTEPAIAFRLLKKHLEERVGASEAKHLIIAITDQSRGALRMMSDNKGYQTLVIPDDVGGRYSVLTPVGLVPLAAGGADIRNLIKGAASMEKACSENIPFADNPAAQYAAARYLLYRSGKKVEILANYNHKLHFLAEWWKQLYGESEGKENIGIFPASVDFTADLHSMGQYIQEGERILFETVLSVNKSEHQLTIPSDPEDLDGLNYLSGRNIDSVNKMAELGTLLAHVDGGVPNIRITIPELSAFYLGQLIYFFEKACGISGYLLGINPFDQPGVEAYKKNMFALLEKPGFKEETEKIRKRLV